MSENKIGGIMEATMNNLRAAVDADTIIGNGEGLCLFVRCKTDYKLPVPFQQVAVGERSKTQLVDGITGVGNQLTQKNLVVGIDGIDH